MHWRYKYSLGGRLTIGVNPQHEKMGIQRKVTSLRVFERYIYPLTVDKWVYKHIVNMVDISDMFICYLGPRVDKVVWLPIGFGLQTSRRQCRRPQNNCRNVI
jgi:hypothetical protein